MSSSSSSVTFHSLPGEADDDNLGIPRMCRCGVPLQMRTSKTSKNPGRLFFCCPRDSELGGLHTFKWTDVAGVEELEKVNDKLACNEEEIRRLKVHIRGCEKSIEELRGEVKCVKLIVLGTVVIGCVYWFY